MGDAQAPTVQPSWERELLFRGALYRQEAAPGEEGRPVFRRTMLGSLTVEWAGAAWEGSGGWKHPARCWVARIVYRYEDGDTRYLYFYRASEEPLPPRAVNPPANQVRGGGARQSAKSWSQWQHN